MGQNVLKQRTSHLVRCDLCKNATHHLYKIRLGDHVYGFCSAMHAEEARMNYETNVKKGVTPSNPNPVEIDEPEGDNISDFE